MHSLARWSLVLLFLAAACGDGDGPTGPSRADVAGIYAVCQLVFTPAGGTLASVSLLDTAIETTNPQVRGPELRVDPGTAIQLAYTPRGAFVERTVGGTFDLSGNRVSLRFSDATSRNALLLPERLDVDFQASPRQLFVATSDPFTVPRARYAELTGQSEANLAPQIEGRLSARFRQGGCT